VYRTIGLLATFSIFACGSDVVFEPGGGLQSGSGDDTSGGGAEPSSSATGAGGFAPHEPCASSEGVRLCGGAADCEWLVPPECLGFGCTVALDGTSFDPGGAGVCWADLPDAAGRQCSACDDGDVCIQRTTDQLVCAPPGVCDALWDLGATAVCRYADKSAYDHQPLPAPSSPCPGGPQKAWPEGLPFMCGGDCGPCDDYFQRCTGRSPIHPFGICVNVEDAFSDPETVRTCSLSLDGTVLENCDTFGYEDTLCAVFDVPPNDVSAARKYGVCLRGEACSQAAQSLPGGIHCYDGDGKQVAP